MTTCSSVPSLRAGNQNGSSLPFADDRADPNPKTYCSQRASAHEEAIHVGYMFKRTERTEVQTSNLSAIQFSMANLCTRDIFSTDCTTLPTPFALEPLHR